MLKALHHNIECFFALPKCNLVLASPWVFCNMCPKERYYGTVKNKMYSFLVFKNQALASLISNLTRYSICSLGNQSSSPETIKGLAGLLGWVVPYEQPHCCHNYGQEGPDGRGSGDVWGQRVGRRRLGNVNHSCPLILRGLPCNAKDVNVW